MPNMRAKVRLYSITKHEGVGETLRFLAVTGGQYGPQGESEDNTYARYTPSAEFSVSVANPALLDQFKPGETYYVDFSRAE